MSASTHVDFEQVMQDDQLAMHWELGLCMLKGLGGHECSGRMTIQHILNKHKTRGSDELRAVSNRIELLAVVCMHANSGDGLADTRWAQRALLEQRANQLGVRRVREVLSLLPSHMGLNWTAIQAYPDPPEA